MDGKDVDCRLEQYPTPTKASFRSRVVAALDLPSSDPQAVYARRDNQGGMVVVLWVYLSTLRRRSGMAYFTQTSVKATISPSELKDDSRFPTTTRARSNLHEVFLDYLQVTMAGSQG